MSEGTHVAELLAPAHEAIETARLVLLGASVVILLVLGGAKLERWLMKRQLAVLDGAAEGGDVDLTEGAGGRRG